MNRTLTYMFSLVTLFAMAHGWSRYTDYGRSTLTRRSQTTCVRTGGKCFTSGECCMDYVCAAFDEFGGQNPQIPGYCVLEKDLRPCASNIDCRSDESCNRIVRKNKEKYCISRLDERYNNDEMDEDLVTLMNGAGEIKQKNKDGKRLGMSCETTSDCAAFTKDGKDQLCCQKVRRYRMKAKQICDRVTGISLCIP